MTWPGVLARCVTACLVFAFGLGTAGVTSAWAERAGAPIELRRAAAAATTLIIVLLLITALRRGVDRRSVRSLLGRPRAAATGFAVVGGSALITFGAAALLGGIAIQRVELDTFVRFLVINGLTALALEAIPEELVFRGYVVDTLRRRAGAWLTGVISTALFLTAGLSSVISWGLGRVVGVDTGPPSIAPNGTPALDYLVLLAVYGTMLVALRQVTGSVWACIAAHLTFLTVNRALLSPQQYGAGLVVETAPDIELLVLVYLALAIVIIAIMSRARRFISDLGS